MILDPSCLDLRRKMRKIATLAYFSPKMPICRNFCGRKCGLWVRGGRNFFDPHQKYPKVFPKKFSWTPPHFWALQPAKSQKTPIFDQKSKNSDLFWPKFLHVGARPAPKKFSESKTSQSLSKIFFGSLTQF